jgi:hypothetical protein
MAHVNNPAFIKQRIIDSKCQNFAIYNDAAKKSLIAQDKSGDLDVEQCANMVEQILANLTGLVYVELCAMSKEEKAKGGGALQNSVIPIQLGGAPSVNGGIGSPGAPFQNYQELLALQEAKFNEKISGIETGFLHKLEIDSLKRQLEEVKNGSIGEQLIKKLAPTLIERYLPPPAARPINGHGETDVIAEDLESADVARVEKAMGEWLSLDTDAINVLEKIVELAKTNPEKYNLAKSLI